MKLAPDLAIVDIRMPPTNSTEGLEAAREIREESPDVGILVLSAHAEVDHAMELLAGGERIGYLLKSRITDVDELIENLERIAAGDRLWTRRSFRSSSLRAARTTRSTSLTPREREVLELMAEGRSNGGIGRLLWVTEGTVEKHVHSILAKLQLPETGEDHRRVLAVLTFLETALTMQVSCRFHIPASCNAERPCRCDADGERWRYVF